MFAFCSYAAVPSMRRRAAREIAPQPSEPLIGDCSKAEDPAKEHRLL